MVTKGQTIGVVSVAVGFTLANLVTQDYTGKNILQHLGDFVSNMGQGPQYLTAQIEGNPDTFVLDTQTGAIYVLDSDGSPTERVEKGDSITRLVDEYLETGGYPSQSVVRATTDANDGSLIHPGDVVVLLRPATEGEKANYRFDWASKELEPVNVKDYQ
ncbi:MAG: hypothetical protein ABIE94_00975 [archaeon]